MGSIFAGPAWLCRAKEMIRNPALMLYCIALTKQKTNEPHTSFDRACLVVKKQRNRHSSCDEEGRKSKSFCSSQRVLQNKFVSNFWHHSVVSKIVSSNKQKPYSECNISYGIGTHEDNSLSSE